MSTNAKSTSRMTVSQLHHAAMEALDEALALEKAGNPLKAAGFFRFALLRESEAAARVAMKLDLEPTRSVLHRSAAAIALRCRDFRQAERLIEVALAGNPHDEIARELRALLDQVNFDRDKDTFLETVAPLKGEVVEVVGRLLFASATSRRGMIRVVDDAGEQHPFVVPAGMMADIVKPLWESRVRAIGIRKGKRKVELRDIDLVANDSRS